MLSRSDTDIVQIIKLFSKYEVRCAFIVPTETGINKSIMDAASNIRNFFLENDIHDYSKQKTGPENKIQLKGYFVNEFDITESIISLYRPNTKLGDPRIWFSGLKKYAKPFNLLAVFFTDNKIFILNASNKRLLESLDSPNSLLREIFSNFKNSLSESAQELLDKLRIISSRGFLPSIRTGDTGVGATLENLLGIKINSSKNPDYKGIEIKASRQLPRKNKAKNRVNLFSQVPNWNISPIKSAIEFLKAYGYKDDKNILRLAVTLDALKPNQQKLMFKTDLDRDLLLAIMKDNQIEEELLVWEYELLKERLLEKHSESFWVKANYRTEKSLEFFHYYQVIHTERPYYENLPFLFNDGIITMDFTLKQKTLTTVRDHGYLFKLWPESFGALFPNPRIYNL